MHSHIAADIAEHHTRVVDHHGTPSASSASPVQPAFGMRALMGQPRAIVFVSIGSVADLARAVAGGRLQVRRGGNAIVSAREALTQVVPAPSVRIRSPARSISLDGS